MSEFDAMRLLAEANPVEVLMTWHRSTRPDRAARRRAEWSAASSRLPIAVAVAGAVAAAYAFDGSNQAPGAHDLRQAPGVTEAPTVPSPSAELL